MVPLEDTHQFLSSDVQFMLHDAAHTFIDSHLLHGYEWHQVKLVKFSLLHAKNIRQDYGVLIWFSSTNETGQDITFVRLVYNWSQRSQRRPSDPFLSNRTIDGLCCLLYKDIKRAVKDSPAAFGLDKAWFDTQSGRMSAPTIALAARAPTTVMENFTSSYEVPRKINGTQRQYIIYG